MADSVPEWMLDQKTPAEVQVTDKPRQPVRDPRLNMDVEAPAQGAPRHRLVTIGDSLTHGFQSLAIHNTDTSYPAIIAHEMGWYERFRKPSYSGFGGLPLNLEFLIRELEKEFGDKLDWWELGLASFRVRHFMDQVEDWWERGPGPRVPNVTDINHNLGIYGWGLRDTLKLTADTLKSAIREPKDQLLQQIVENANERAALRVLESAGKGEGSDPARSGRRTGRRGYARETGPWRRHRNAYRAAGGQQRAA